MHLWRYTLEEVIRRAQLREGEQNYDLTQNNCENFVMWCICGANVSLQATLKRRAWWEVVKALILLPLRKHVPNYAVVKYTCNWWMYGNRDYSTFFIGVWGLDWEFEKVIIVFTVGAVKIMRAKFDMHSCYRELEGGVITKREYQDKVSEIVLSSLFCIGGGYLSRIYNYPARKPGLPDYVSIPGLVIGTYSGVAGGHLVGKLVIRYNFLWMGNLATWITKGVQKYLPRCLSTKSHVHQEWFLELGFFIVVLKYSHGTESW